MSDHYNLLGVPPGASEEEIRRAFRREAKRSHPDLHAQRPAAEREALHRRFIQLAQAYQVLGDPEQRRAYDRRRAGDARAEGKSPNRESASAGPGPSTHSSAPRQPRPEPAPHRPTPRPTAGSTRVRPVPRPTTTSQADLNDVRDILREAEGSLAKFGLDLRQPTEVVLEELLDWARGLYRDLAGAVRGKGTSAHSTPSGAGGPVRPQRPTPKPSTAASPKPPLHSPESASAALNELSVERELEQLKRGTRAGTVRRTAKASSVDDELTELKRKHWKNSPE